MESPWILMVLVFPFSMLAALLGFSSAFTSPAMHTRVALRSARSSTPARISSTLCTASLDPGYMFVPRCEGAASALPKYTPKPGISNYVSVNVTSNSFIGPPPASIFELAALQFSRNLLAIFGKYDEVSGPLSPEVQANRAKLKSLKLSTRNILKREEARGGIPVDTPAIIKIPYIQLCEVIDVVFAEWPVIERFFFLETVARMPYFSYVSMLHLYETLGFWRRDAETKRIHGDEEYNEYHHLLIMEALGGDQDWTVRFLAQHSAVAYYWVLVALFMASPSLGYLFSVLLEGHAVDTYREFLESNEEVLDSLPVPEVARDYYNSVGYYLSVGGKVPGFARTAPIFGEEPKPDYGDSFKSLGDVFRAIIKDEADHVLTMKISRGDNPVL